MKTASYNPIKIPQFFKCILSYFYLDKISKTKYLLYTFVFCLLCNPSNAQNTSSQDSNFNRIFYETATTLSATDMNRALVVADSLFEKSENSLQKIKSLMLLATLKERKGEISEALIDAMKAEKLASAAKDENWQIRISGFLSTTFRGIGLHEEGLKYLEIAEKANAKIQSPIIQSFLNQERAYYYIDEKKYTSAINELQNAKNEFKKIPEASQDGIFLATTYQMLGECYLELDDLNEAYSNYQESLKTLKESESELKGFNYLGLGEIEMSRKNYDSAFKYYNMAESYANQSDNFNLKSVTYKNLAAYYKETGNATKAGTYDENYLKLVEIHSNQTKAITNQLIREFGEESEKNNKNIIALQVFSAFILLLLIIFILVNRQRRKTDNRRNKELIKTNEAFFPLINDDIPIENEAENEIKPIQTNKRTNKRTNIMSIEAEEKLLKKLKKMEAGNFFLQKEISISALAVKLNTNQKYLSYVINTHKGKDFNNYINELRINYIIDKLQHEEIYLDYKIAFLAEESGFSSHSKFTSVFKNVTGISPSAFIGRLKKEVSRL